MKQILHNLRTGKTTLEDVPAPTIRKGHLLIQTTYSLVSLGTEKMLVEFGKSNLIQKARQQPDRVKQVINKIKTDGLMPTIETVFNKLGEPLALGYCNVGKVVEIGEAVTSFKVGDRVVSNGAHAEFVCVPVNLAASIPDTVADEEASFTVLGAIGLQGIRLLQPTLGETVVVIGMGLIGILTAQLLSAAGCRVIGVDIDDHKLHLCAQHGVITCNPLNDDVVKFVEAKTGNSGADGVIITASSKTNDIISQAARMCRKRGRIILVGVVGLEISRAEFYEKELSFQVSCSYGPGRYDENYEIRGNDYPLPFVRWTEKRNFEAVLECMSSGKLQVKNMITELVDLSDYEKIYGSIGKSNSIASILKYNANGSTVRFNTIELKPDFFKSSNAVIGIIGAGNFTKMTLLPALKASDAAFKYIASEKGVSGTALAKKYGFARSTTDYTEILRDEDVDLVLITTRHDKHATLTEEALQYGKHVFVEKPLALTAGELDRIIAAYNESGRILTVGFNRRFSPHAVKVKTLLGQGPLNVICTMNAGYIPDEVWVHDLKTGGGRIIGEACHYFDLITYFTGSRITEVCMNALGKTPRANTDNASILLKYKDGSAGVINYFSNGAKTYPKERIEIYSQQRTAVIDNFRQTTGFGFRGLSRLRTSIDKGHRRQFTELIRTVKTGGGPLIPIDEIINTTKATFAAIESLKTNNWIKVE